MKVLKKQQIRTLQGSLADPRSYAHYLKDIDVVYLDANFWHYLDMADGDLEQAGQQYFDEKLACVNACVEAGVKQMIYMALADFPEDKFVPHFHAKAKGMSCSSLSGNCKLQLYARLEIGEERAHAYDQWCNISNQLPFLPLSYIPRMLMGISYIFNTLQKIRRAIIPINTF
jgi:hypothetical protein